MSFTVCKETYQMSGRDADVMSCCCNLIVICHTHVWASSLPPSWQVGSGWVHRRCPLPLSQRLQSRGYDLRKSNNIGLTINKEPAQTQARALDVSAFSSVTPSVSDRLLDHWVKSNPSHQTPTAQARLSYNSLTSKSQSETTWLGHPCREAAEPLAQIYSFSTFENDSRLTEHQPVAGELPSGVVGKLHRIHVDVLMAVWAHRLYDPPADLIPWFLEDKTQKS